MEFDIADLEQLEANGTLINVIMHEMGHVLGFGTLWERMGLLQGIGTHDPRFIGRNAMTEFARLVGSQIPIPIPVENIGEIGTKNSHWRDSIFGNEVMTSILGGSLNPMSRLTLAALQDMGYSVKIDAADAFVLPNANQLASIRADQATDHRQQEGCNCKHRQSKTHEFAQSITR
ncbi:MAG: hypothetical protein HC934_05540 [Acaryochloridaceae cyanobacterium SU_2_1]|nr:hypothetical protein [Acaryochloridaceae cyanobacterium SU_2_1]